MTKIANDINAHRAFWANIARENGWYKEPFYVQVWQDMDGVITDSVGTTALTEDVIIEVETFICPHCKAEREYEKGSGDCKACEDCCECIWTADGMKYCTPYN
jgi:hypothetical protein